MTAKQSKVIKRLTKQVKKLNARIDDMGREIKTLRETANAVIAVQMTGDPQDDSSQIPRPAVTLSKEMADTIIEAAEEIEGLSGQGKPEKGGLS